MTEKCIPSVKGQDKQHVPYVLLNIESDIR